jgi:aquaporin Z
MAETYGTFVILFLGTFSYVMLVGTNPVLAFVGSAVVYGGSYVAMHYTLSHISGAHFNPMLTIAATIDGRLTRKQAFNHVLAQVMGALAAVLMIVAVIRAFPGVAFEVLGFGALSPYQTPPLVAFLLEMFVAFFIVYVYLAVSQRRIAAWTGLSVGVMITVVMLSTGLLTGGHANPARSIASLIVMGVVGRQQLLVYIAASVVGSLLAQWFYKHLKYEDQHDVA